MLDQAAKVLDPATASLDVFEAELERLLVMTGQADARALDRARRVAQQGGGRFDLTLTKLGILSERGLAEAYSRLFALPLAAADDYPAEPILPDALKAKFLRRARAVPLAAAEDSLRLGVVDPLDRFAVQAAAAATGRRVSLHVAVPMELDAALGRLYQERHAEPDADLAAVAEHDPFEQDAERLKDLASEAPIIRMVNQIIARAVETQASDIHIEPFEDRLRVRYRYDGLLHEVDSPPLRLQAAIVSRIKIMAHLDIAERRLPQDGRIKATVRGHEIDLRVSTLPSLHGESVALRVLDRSAIDLDFSTLGLDPDTLARLLRLLELPHGVILVSGPTGSGKTTTLYTALLHLNAVMRKIITVEDPVEYQLGGVSQIPVKPEIGLTFANLLRSILRHNPNVIMIGEIRDHETAEIALEAGLTGHLVLSTLHTNSAAASVTRLRDMGVEDYLISATLNGVLAQRLVRRLCEACRRPAPATQEQRARFGLDRFAPAGEIVLHEPVGCAECRFTGFRGRRAIGEILVPDKSVHALVMQRAGEEAIERAARQDGMRSMYENGMGEVIAGRTSIEELLRSIRAEV